MRDILAQVLATGAAVVCAATTAAPATWTIVPPGAFTAIDHDVSIGIGSGTTVVVCETVIPHGIAKLV